jgi:soluble lytic murein transglycosylase-like protein
MMKQRASILVLRIAPALTTLCGIACLVGLWALMTLPQAAQLARKPAAMQSTVAASAVPVAPTPVKTDFELIPPYESFYKGYPVPDWIAPRAMKIDPALVYAIIRQESAFNPRAVSPAGATGVMQLMPSTADYVIRRYRLNEVQLASLGTTQLPRSISNRHLTDPVVNMVIGQHYLRYLADKSYIDGNLVYLLAAYNAGPANLIRWQKQFGHITDPMSFVARIPFAETRDYVRKVLANYQVYQYQLYGSTQARNALLAREWPQLATPATYQNY